MLRKGYVQVYTGNGKGKTTASLGLCLRALSSGFKVFYAQFIKDGTSSEFKILSGSGFDFTHRAFGSGRFIKGIPSDADLNSAKAGLAECFAALSSGEYDLVVLDEANGAVNAGLFSAEDLLNLIKSKADNTELIITGRNASPSIIEAADLVTEMVDVKHYMAAQGVTAREGIEF